MKYTVKKVPEIVDGPEMSHVIVLLQNEAGGEETQPISGPRDALEMLVPDIVIELSATGRWSFIENQMSIVEKWRSDNHKS